MRLIGVLGGMSPESTILYYRFMNEAVRERTGDPAASARVLMHGVDFSALSALQRAGAWDEAGELLAGAARGLVAGGAELVVISANTMHLVAGAVRAALPPHVELLHIGDVVADALDTLGADRVLLTGTAYTMEHPFLRDHLAARGITATVPGAADRAWLQQCIYVELTRGVVTPEAIAAFRALVAAAAGDGAQAVVLGCTELGLLVEGETPPVPLLDTARLHAEAAVAAASPRAPCAAAARGGAARRP
jgi:aspartate racemase